MSWFGTCCDTSCRYVAAVADVGAYLTQFFKHVCVRQDNQQVQQWRQYLQHFVYETVGRLRIGELFDIVVGALHCET